MRPLAGRLKGAVTFPSGAVSYDVRHALRMIRTKSGFSVPVLLSLALGIGANIAIFSVLNAVLIRPLPYPNSDALVSVANSAVFHGERFPNMPLSLSMYSTYRETVQTFDQFGVWIAGAATVTGLGDSEQISTVTMTHGVLPALGVSPRLGEWFSRDHEAPGAERAAILSYGYWQRKFGGDPGVIGRTLMVDFIPRHIVGVMPQDFRFLSLTPDILLAQRLSGDVRTDEFSYSAVARLKPGVTLAQATEDIGRVLKIWSSLYDPRIAEQLQFKPGVRPLKREVIGDVGATLRMITGAIALVLLLVCANVGNLVQVRAEARRQEFAIRAALGAGWTRIARGLLAESLTLGLIGGAFGLALAYAGLQVLVANAGNLPRVNEVSIDPVSILFAIACSIVSSLLFGSIAILKAAKTARVENTRGASAGGEQLRAQNVLVVAQVGLALVLLIAAGLLGRSFMALHSVSPGFTRAEHIQTVRILIPAAQVREPDRVLEMQANILERIAAIPGVTATAFASALPLETEYRNGNTIAVEGKDQPGVIPPNRMTKHISPGLFAAQGTRLLAGRDFTWDDIHARRAVAIVSENMARENWGDPSSALGKRLRAGMDGRWIEVVGVVENVHEDGAAEPAPTTVYFRAGVWGEGASAVARRSVTFAIRSARAGTDSFIREISSAVHSVSPDVPLAKVRTLNDVFRESLARTSFALALLGLAGAMALAISFVGVYGVLSYAVAQRRREVGIRIALGAEPASVRALFVRRGLALASAGGAIGLLSAAALSRWIASLLFGITAVDPLTYAVCAITILTASIVASSVPARRAAAVDPMETLRSE